jgi:hypothetical protein
VIAKNPAEALVRITARLESGRLPAAADFESFVLGFRRWLAGDETLDEALGLAGGAGRRTARTAWRISQRNALLRRAHSLLDAPSPWKGSVALAHEVAVFESRVWPRWRELDAPPLSASELRSVLFSARRLGKVPGSARGLHGICCETSGPY